MEYRNVMALYSHDEATKCKIFPSTLERSVMHWYGELPPRSMKKTLRYWQTSLLMTFYFIIMKDESLRTYIKWFQTELADIEKLDDKISTTTFKRGYTSSRNRARNFGKRNTINITLAECLEMADDITT
ncbi:hypothetical protein DVH24_003185 [Malus domestica]|uniref:Retrotransposon gag domain-containing protein n=1 Tax=Malus domestica TaxID=3750 RepID=A0A498K6Y6_MALDO|nr:hypothetical protein DVH24_003185 [Malus domestica]